MALLKDLKKESGLYIQCPTCQDKFSLMEAGLFDATQPLPPAAVEYLASQKRSLREREVAMQRLQRRVSSYSEIGAESCNIGKVVEKIAPSLPGFPVQAEDCRALFEPVDYVVFRGLSNNREIESLVFVDVKSGNGRLNDTQRQLQKLVEAGKVSLTITARAEETL